MLKKSQFYISKLQLSENIMVQNRKPSTAPASGGDDNYGCSHTVDGSLNSSQGSGVCDVCGAWGQHAQLLKQLLVVNGGLSFTGNLHTHTHFISEINYGIARMHL